MQSTIGKYIISDQDILGGTSVIQGTRVRIGCILFLLKDGYNLVEVAQDYPHIDQRVYKLPLMR